MVDNIGPKQTRSIPHQDHYKNYIYPGIANPTPSGVVENDEYFLKEQDRLLPIANVGRIMKQILPPNAKISKEAKETMQECVSEFISFVTGEASDKCHREKRKTVNGDDICWALVSLGFDDYGEGLKRYLAKYRDAEGERINQNKASAGSINYDQDQIIIKNDQQRDQEMHMPVAPFSFDLMDKRMM